MIAKFSVKKPYTVLVGVVLVIVLGVVAFTRMTTDLLPDMSLPYVIVVTTDMGASPEEVESDVTAPIEAAMATTSNIKNVSSSSYDNYSMVILEYEQSTNMDSILIEIQQELDQLGGSFPDTAGTPMIMQIDPDMMPVMIASADVDGMDQLALSAYVTDELLPYLESIEGVASVTPTGVLTESVEVTLDQAKIDALNEKIRDKIDEQFTEAKEELDDAQAKLENGKRQLENGKEELASQMGNASNEIINNKINVSETGLELQDKLDGIAEAHGSLMDGINGLQQAYDGAVKLDEAISQLKKVQETIGTVKAAILAQLGLSEESFAALPEEQRTAIEKEIAKALDEQVFAALKKNGMDISSEEDLAKQITALEGQLQEINKTLAEQEKNFADAGVSLKSYQDIPAALAKLSENEMQLRAGADAIKSAQQQLSDGKTQLDGALGTLNETQINTILEMSSGYADMAVGLSQIEEGRTKLEEAQESAEESADLNNILTMDMLTNIFVAQNFSMPAGYVGTEETRYLVRVGDRVDSVDTLSAMVLLDMGIDGIEPITVADVASVEVVDDAGDSYSRINGNPAIMLSVEKQTGYSTGDVTDRVLERFEALEKEKEGLRFAVLMDQGIYIDMIVDSVIENMVVGAILAVIVLILFLKDFKPTFVIACSIPLSVIFAVVLMYFTDISLNMISLSGLALGVGMLVDNSIVVIENIYRLRNEGYSVRKAAVEGAGQMTGAIIGSTLTTICVFAPIIFTEGITRQLFVDIALTIAFTLTASLIVAMTFVPMMASVTLKKTKEIRHDFFERIKEGYGAVLTRTLKWKPLVLIAAVALLAASMAASLSRGFTFMDMDMETNQLSVTVTAKENEMLSEEELRALADEVTERLLTVEGIDTVGAMTGGSALSMMGGSDDAVSMYLLLDEESEVSMDAVTEQIYALTADMDCAVTAETSSSDFSAFFGSGISVEIKGRDLEKLQKLAAEAAAIIEQTEGTVDVRDGLDDVTDSFTVSVNKEKAAEYGMTVAQVYQLVYAKMAADSPATTIAADLKDYEVYVQSEEQAETTLEDIKNLTFTHTDSEGEETEVKLSEIAEFVEGSSLNTINRDAQTRYISVTAGIDDDHNVTLVSAEISKRLAQLDLPEGYSVRMTGEDETINDAMGQLQLMLMLAVIFIYLIMVAQFQSLLSPFIIMFTIPLAFTGGFFALYFTGYEVSVVAMIGFVMLAGIIVNNGIVMVDYINQLRRDGLGKKEAIVEAGMTRLRPILMTALTTILAMSTMALGMGSGSEMMQPMAIVTVGGLVYGTLLTLIVVPCIYDMLNREKNMVDEEL